MAVTEGFGTRRVLGEAAVVVALSLAAAAAAWIGASPRLPLVADREVYEFELKQPLLGAADALALYAAGSHLFVDTRPVELEDVDHVPGAIALRPDHFDDDLRAVVDFLTPDEPILLYGGGADLQATAAVAGQLAARGYADLTLLDGGFPAWRAAGGEVEAGEGAP